MKIQTCVGSAGESVPSMTCLRIGGDLYRMTTVTSMFCVMFLWTLWSLLGMYEISALNFWAFFCAIFSGPRNLTVYAWLSFVASRSLAIYSDIPNFEAVSQANLEILFRATNIGIQVCVCVLHDCDGSNVRSIVLITVRCPLRQCRRKRRSSVVITSASN